MELHGASVELIAYVVDNCEDTENLDQALVNSQPLLMAAFENDDLHVASIISTAAQLAKSSESFDKIYPNLISPPIREERVAKEAKTPRAASAPKAPKITLELPIKVNMNVTTAIPPREFFAKCQELGAANIKPCFPSLQEAAGWSNGDVASVIAKTTGLSAAQFVNNEVWKEGNYTE